MKGGKFLDTLTPPTSLPDTVAIGEWLSELVGTLQSQLDMVASGAAMLPYEYLTKRYLNESVPLGATANFQHETNGTLTGRFVKLGPPNDSGFARPVGYRTNSSQLYEVTDRVSESSEALFAGLDITGAGETGEYGWILTGGVSPVNPELTGTVSHLGEVGWVADGNLATNAATTVGRLVSNGADLQVLLNAQPTPVNDKTLFASLERLNARLDQMRAELATKPDSNSLNQLFQNLIITSITALNQTVDLIQTQMQRIDVDGAAVEVTQTLRAMADFRLELANQLQGQDVVRQQMHVNAQASLHSRESSKVWSDQSGVFAESSWEAAGNAQIQAGEALIQAGFAQGFAANASLSEANALAYMQVTAKYTAQSFPTTFENGLILFNGDNGAAAPTSGVAGVDVTYGPYIKNSIATTYGAIARRARSPSAVGKKVKVRALLAHESGTARSAELRIEHWSSAEGGARISTADYQTAVISSATPGWYEFQFTTTTGAFINPEVIINFPAPYTAIQRCYALEMIDESESAASAASASASSSSAAAASSSAATATSQALLIANAINNTVPSDFRNDGRHVYPGYEGDPSLITPLSAGNVSFGFADVAGVGRVLRYVTTGTGDISNIGLIPVLAGRKYGVRCRYSTESGTRSHTTYLITTSKVGVYIATPGNFVTTTATTTWQTDELIVDGDAILAAGATHIRGLSRFSAGAAVGRVVSLEVFDATTLASVNVNAGAISTINGAAAFHETIVAAAGGFPAVSRLKAGASGSTFDLAASKLTIYNPSNTSQWQEVARFEGGQAKLNDAIIRKLQVGPRSDSTIYFPVQLKPRIFVGSDGQTITYETGKTMGAAPERIVADTTGIPVGTGEALDVRATAVSATQFTVYAKKTTPSAPALQTSAAGTVVGGTPQIRTHKPTMADAYNGYYTFQFDVTLTLNYAEPDFGGMYQCAYDGYVDFYVDSGSGWVKIGSTYLFKNEYVSGYPASTNNYANQTFTLNWPNVIGQHGSYEFGIHPGAGTSGLNLDNVTYSTQTSGTVTALTQTIPFLVYPPPAD